MRVLVFGASGAIGRQLLPLLAAAGHDVAGATRSERTAHTWRAAGLDAVVVDAMRPEQVAAAVAEAAPDAIIHQLTDLAARDYAANARLRTVATRAIVDAAGAHGVERVVAQSIAWNYLAGPGLASEDDPVGDAPGIVSLESAVAEAPLGVVLRYGLLYGPGTWYDADGEATADARSARLAERRSAITSFVHVTDAARAAAAALDWPAGVVNVVDDDPAPLGDWMAAFTHRLGLPEQPVPDDAPPGRAASNARLAALGFRLEHPSWRAGFAALGPGAS